MKQAFQYAIKLYLKKKFLLNSWWIILLIGIVLDFDEAGHLYVRTPSGNTYNPILDFARYRNRTNDGNEYIHGESKGVQFRVLLWK